VHGTERDTALQEAAIGADRHRHHALGHPDARAGQELAGVANRYVLMSPSSHSKRET
jgi:hypothetical protein